MPRYTLIWLRQNSWENADDFPNYLKRRKILNEIYYKVAEYVQDREGIALQLDIDKILILANSLDKESHLNLLKELESTGLSNINMISIVHENPIYTLIKASSLLPTRFYFQDGKIGLDEYYVAIICLKDHGKIDLMAYTIYLRDIAEIAFALSNLGNIALVHDHKVIALLSKNSLKYLSAMDNLHIGIGIDLYGFRALDKAYNALKIAIQEKRSPVIFE